MLPAKRTLTLALALPATPATLIGAAPTAGVGDSRVKALVHIAAFTPDKGESAAQPAARFPASTLGETVSRQPYPLPDGGIGTELMARRAGSHTADVNASHAVAVSRPAEVTDVILDAARATR
ncbi:hypothetical protein AB0F57_10560 [Streptomyces tanashiensis]|uniref:hypothetical protein n=1 Tax=Streptomyces tanashiensis TaxID=67367 RepID=UPI0033C0EE65